MSGSLRSCILTTNWPFWIPAHERPRGAAVGALRHLVFVEYLWDDPAVEGDEEDGSPKLAYAVPVTVRGVPMLLGSGIYPVAPAR